MKNHPKELSKGCIYVGEVDRISNSRNGIIEMQTKHINLGNISSKKVGELVAFEYTGKQNGSVVDETPEEVEEAAGTGNGIKKVAGTEGQYISGQPTTRKISARPSNKHSGLLNNYNNDA